MVNNLKGWPDDPRVYNALVRAGIIDSEGRWVLTVFDPTYQSKQRKLFDEESYKTPIGDPAGVDLSVRVFNSLKRATGISDLDELLEMLDKGPDAMLAIRNFGEKSLDELVERLKAKGYLPSE